MEHEFREHIRRWIESQVFAVWAPQTNRRGGIRDAPTEYAIVQQKVDTLRARQINRP